MSITILLTIQFTLFQDGNFIENDIFFLSLTILTLLKSDHPNNATLKIKIILMIE